MYHTLEKERPAERRYHRNTERFSDKVVVFLNRLMDRKIAFFMILLMIVMLFSILFITTTVTAKLPAERQRVTASVVIEEGDSLWAIAEEYYSDEYGSIPEYIEVIKTCNSLKSDTIHEGGYLIVPYYQD
ncbi:MAG: LysM peptidoglycan-binding domain-containing protein [Lachnospiraceae bacterium]|nr:LysM peptidoglycan-binding domain-containing protein [Lachnospiraceae bacterium]